LSNGNIALAGLKYVFRLELPPTFLGFSNNEDAKVSFGADFINPDSNLIYDTANGDAKLKNSCDYKLALQTMF